MDEKRIDSVARSLAVTSAANYLSVMLHREYYDIPHVELCRRLSIIENVNQGAEVYWVTLSQVGRSHEWKRSDYLLLIEQLLQIISSANQCRLWYVLSRTDCDFSIKLGVQTTNGTDTNYGNIVAKRIAQALPATIRAIWPETEVSYEESLSDARSDARWDNELLRLGPGKDTRIYPITGVPSDRANQEGISFLEKLMLAMQNGSKWQLLVIADPIDKQDTSKILYACREMLGSAETMAKFSFSESSSDSVSRALSMTQTVTEGWTRSTTERDVMGKAALAAGAGLALASIFFPPAAAAAGAVGAAGATATGAAASASAAGMLGAKLLGLSMFSNALAAIGKTKTVSESGSRSGALGETTTFSDSQTKTYSQNIVNKHMEAIGNLLKSYEKRFQLSQGIGMWNVAAYFIAENVETGSVGTSIIPSVLSGDSSELDPIRVHDIHGHTDRYKIAKSLIDYSRPKLSFVDIPHPFGAEHSELSTVLSTRELARYICFPTQGVPGIAVKQIPPETGFSTGAVENLLPIGVHMLRGAPIVNSPFCLDASTLAKHTLVCGINGSGKTNTIIGLLNSLTDEAWCPFLVIEPAKQEYVRWAIDRNRKLEQQKGVCEARKDRRWINVYIPGREMWAGLSLDKLYLNPFDFVWLNKNEPPKTMEHIDRLKTIINASLPMQEVLPVLMEELVYMAYGVSLSAPTRMGERAPCWLPSNPQKQRFPRFDESVKLPNFSSLAIQLTHLFSNRTYAKDVQSNLRAALETRIDSFKRGWRKELLNRNKPRNTRKDWEMLFEHPTVINLTSLTSDEDKAFFMAILLLFVYEYRQELCESLDPENDARKKTKLQHLLVIEEAHRILGHTESTSAFAAAPRQKVSALFSNMISEVRAYGQGILIADQVPGRLNEDAVKNTNLKIVHKLVAADDRLAMAAALNLFNGQERIIGDLNVGEALVRGDMDKEACMVKINLNT